MDKENIWKIELYKLYENRNLEDLRKRLIDITDILVYIHEILAENNIKLNDKDVYSEQLVIKFHLQNLSLIELSKGVSIKSKFLKKEYQNIKFLDISSIITIIRSQYESLLMYQHLYINSTNENHQKLRFESWIMSSMMLRSKIFSEAQQKFPERLLQEQNSIKNLQESIKNNPEYNNLSEKQKKNLIQTGSGKLFKSWDTIFDESKFNRQGVFSKIYYITSVYAHSEGTLALQLKESKHLMEDPNMQESNYLMLFYSYLMTNIMIKNVTNKFPLVKERFESLDEKIKYEVDFNYQLSFK